MKLLKNAVFGMILALPMFVFSSIVIAASPTFDAKALAVKAVNNELSEEFIKALSYDEFESVAIEVSVLAGFEREEIEKFLKENRKTFQKNFYAVILNSSSSCYAWLSDFSKGSFAFSLGSCKQGVEQSILGSGITFPYAYYEDWGCDDDWSDREYRFDFWTTWNVDPNRIKWFTYNPWVGLVFATVYNGVLLGSSLCNNTKSLCLGDRGVMLAGGPSVVLNSIFILYQ